MRPYTYLLIDLLTIIVCFGFSFHKSIQFHKHFGSFLKASVFVAIPFIIWDIWFTKMGVWWFNVDYTIGVSIFGLPLEEWLFFICIPFSCVFTFFFLDKFFSFSGLKRYNSVVAWLTICVCVSVAISFSQKAYPLLTSVAAIMTMVYLHFVVKVDWIAKASFVFCILMLGFFPVNGILTGSGLDSPIVNYNSSEILNIRLFTIPIEDTVYGYTQFLLVWYVFNVFRFRSVLKLV